MATFADGDTGSSIRTKINAAIEAVDALSTHVDVTASRSTLATDNGANLHWTGSSDGTLTIEAGHITRATTVEHDDAATGAIDFAAGSGVTLIAQPGGSLDIEEAGGVVQLLPLNAGGTIIKIIGDSTPA